MIEMSMRLRPRLGSQDLAWLRQTVDDVHDIYAFVLREHAFIEVEERERPLPASGRDTVVDGLVAEEGTPLVRMREGSLILQMSQFVDQTLGVQALVALGLLFKKGPEIVAWPNRLRQSWYSSKEEALRARQAYERLTERSVVDMLEDLPKGDEQEPEGAARPRTAAAPGRTARGAPAPARGKTRGRQP